MLREKSLTEVLEIDRFSRGGRRLFDGVRGELEQFLSRKGVVANVQRPELLEYRIKVLARCQAGEDDPDGIPPILCVGCFLGAIAPTLDRSVRLCSYRP